MKTKDKIQNRKINISDTTTVKYFDSNFYPTLISWLPLKPGYTELVAIYDYNPNAATGVVKAGIQKVTKGMYQTASSGQRPVWIVTVSDEISGITNGHSTYYIDIEDRKLWKQEIDAGGRKMEMIMIEK